MFENKLSAVVFDLDNTLVSSSLAYKKIKESLKCPSEEDILDFVDSLPEEQAYEVTKSLHQFEMNDAISAKILPGADKLIGLLNELKIPSAIVTRNNSEAASFKVSNNNIDIPLLISREQFQAKPAPDALHYLAKYWDIPESNILYVGDYLYDLQMANNAKTQSCLINYGQALEFEKLATFTVENLNQLSDVIVAYHQCDFSETC